jgi:MobA/MobL family
VTAKYFLHIKTFSRGQGSSVTKAAAYRAGERIRDERSGAVHDYTKRIDVAHAEIVLPEQYAGRAELDWARNRSALWNAAQQSGKLWNSRIGREELVLMPEGLSAAQRAALGRSFARELAERYHSAVDFTVHRPRERADPRHHHAHLLVAKINKIVARRALN